MAHDMNLSTGLVTTGFPLALRGYDPVSYGHGAPLRGSADFAGVESGATYYFASQENLDAFKAAPERYLPSFGGFCAYGVSVGKKFDGDPMVYRMVEGRLHLNLNPAIQAAFDADLHGAVAKADETWRTIANRPPAEL